MAKINWNYAPSAKALELAEAYEVHTLFTTILANRGLQEDEIIAVLTNDADVILPPSSITHAAEAAQAIYDFIMQHPEGRIIIHADYDCDGITSGYVMGTVLAQYHENVTVNYPERTEGYGLQMKFCKLIVETMTTPTLLITVDNGVAAINEVQYLIDHGVNVIVTDHHKPKEVLPNCLVVDPHAFEEDMNTSLCGCGVAFKVMQLFLALIDTEFDLNRLLPAVAIGTLADMMPMSLENIYYIRNGIAIMNSEECPTPLKAFKNYNGIDAITPTTIGWDLGPTLNACGRMGNIQLAGNFIFSDSMSEEDIMDEYVAEMIDLNETRKDHTKKYVAYSKEQLNPEDYANIVVIESCEKGEEGLAGVIANKVIEVNNKPTIILTKTEHNTATGSARTPDGLSIIDILDSCKETINKYGGHESAAGLNINLDKLEDFKKAINLACSRIDMTPYLSSEDDDTIIDKTIDYKIRLNDLSLETLAVIDSLPYDKNSFTAPVVSLMTKVEKIEPTKTNPANAFVTLKDGYLSKRFWVANAATLFQDIDRSKEVELIGTLDKNFMQSKTTPVVIKIIEARQA